MKWLTELISPRPKTSILTEMGAGDPIVLAAARELMVIRH
jgi:hypothetical protein